MPSILVTGVTGASPRFRVSAVMAGGAVASADASPTTCSGPPGPPVDPPPADPVVYVCRDRACSQSLLSRAGGGATFATLAECQSGCSTNQAPTDIALSNATIPEDRPVGTTVGFLSATDPNAGDTCTYSLVSGAGSDDNDSFAIVGGALKTAAALDFSAKRSYSIRVRATDAAGLNTEKSFTISVTAVYGYITALTNTNLWSIFPFYGDAVSYWMPATRNVIAEVRKNQAAWTLPVDGEVTDYGPQLIGSTTADIPTLDPQYTLPSLSTEQYTAPLKGRLPGLPQGHVVKAIQRVYFTGDTSGHGAGGMDCTAWGSGVVPVPQGISLPAHVTIVLPGNTSKTKSFGVLASGLGENYGKPIYGCPYSLDSYGPYPQQGIWANWWPEWNGIDLSYTFVFTGAGSDDGRALSLNLFSWERPNLNSLGLLRHVYLIAWSAPANTAP